MAFGLTDLFSSIKKSTAQPPKRVVGIDVGSSSIKVVELEQTERAITLRTYGELQLGPYVEKDLGDAVSLPQQKLVEALVDVIRESKVKAKDGVLAIPLNSSFVTVMPISTKEGEELDPKIRVEARKYIPVPLSDVLLDWSPLNTYGDEHVTVNEVLLAAIQSDAFERYQALMGAVKMVSQPSEIELFSTVRGVVRPDDTTLGIMDFGAETSKLYIARNGAIERIHRVYEGGATCTKRIANMLNVSFEEAENLKRYYTQDAPQARDMYKAYISTIERSVQEFKRVLEQYEARNGAPIARMAITGGVAAFPGLTQYMSDALSRDVMLATPFDKVAYPAFMEDVLTEVGLSFAVALGAALRPFEVTE